jgi:hypothetical protein
MLQNFAPRGSGLPHSRHAAAIAAPHWSQKRPDAAAPHAGHWSAMSPCRESMERGEGSNLRGGGTALKGSRVTGLPAPAAAARCGMRNA